MHPNETELNAYADGSLDPAARADLEPHIQACASCRQLVDDIREILSAADALEPLDPPVRAWPRIARAIELEREHASEAIGRMQPGGPGRAGVPAVATGSSPVGRFGRRLTWLAAAAGVVLATAVGLRFVPRAGDRVASSTSQSSGTATAAGEASQSVEMELRAAESHYEKAIDGLEQIANAERNTLDPRTAATLQKNLAVIDQAISESRAAVRSQPASEPAQSSLIENFKMKIGLLQDTVALINELRKGNEAGAGRIVSGLKEKGD